MIEEFIDLMNEVQDYRCHRKDCQSYTQMMDVIRERRILIARIERVWREGGISLMQKDTLDGILEGEEDDE